MIKKIRSFPGLIHVFIILLVSLGTYANVIDGPFLFDDKDNILENPVIKNFSCFSPFESNYFSTSEACSYPKNRITVFFTFAANYKINGLDPRGYHLLNISIHFLTGILLYALIRLLFSAPALEHSSLSGYSPGISFFSALLFVSHPVQTQAVSYIAQRFASLAALFYILTLVLYLLARLCVEKRQAEWFSPRAHGKLFISLFYAASLGATVLAMTSKEIAITLPFTILLLECVFFSGSLAKRITWPLPFLLTLGIIPVIHYTIRSQSGSFSERINQASVIAHDISRLDYLITEFRILITYLRLLLFPINQNLDYDYPVYHSFFDFPVFLSFCLLSLFFVLGLFLLCQAKGRNSALRISGFGISWFFITLAVESTLIPLNVIFEHRLYLPSMGILFSAVTLVYFFVLNVCDKNTLPYGKGLLWMTILLLSLLTISRNRVWSNDRLLWEDVVKKSPEKERGYTNLGIAYEKAGLMDEAITQHLKAFELKPGKPEVSLNLGNDFSEKGDIKQAVFYYGNALRLLPDYPEARNNLGRVLELKGNLNLAVENYLAALKLEPTLVGPLINIGNIFLRQNKPEQAIQFYCNARDY